MSLTVEDKNRILTYILSNNAESYTQRTTIRNLLDTMYQAKTLDGLQRSVKQIHMGKYGDEEKWESIYEPFFNEIRCEKYPGLMIRPLDENET